MPESQTESEIQHFDNSDPLRPYKDRFVIDDPSIIYLDGNSLGRLPKSTIDVLNKSVRDEWGCDLIDSWNKSWYTKSLEIGDTIAKIIGAEEGEVIVADSTSVNLFKLAHAALNYQSDRSIILTDEFNFPSDLYIFQGLIREKFSDLKIEYLRSEDGVSISSEEIKSKITDQVALVSLSHVTFKSAFMYDMEEVTKMAHEQGALVLWDLSHSVGAVPIDVSTSEVDCAVGCTYKYLNGGPGAPAFLYVRKNLQDQLSSPISGWFGANDPFDFNLDFEPATGIQQFLSGTPPILSMGAIKPGAEMILEAGIDAIRKKSILLSERFIHGVTEYLLEYGYSISSPLSAEERGSHVSISHKEAGRIIKALMDPSIDGFKIIPDFRRPDNIRFGFAPLYNSFQELEVTIRKLKMICENGLYEQYDDTMPEVT